MCPVDDYPFQVQTRSEEDGIRFHANLAQAMAYAEVVPSCWKISFSLPNGERVRFVKRVNSLQTDWCYEPIPYNEEDDRA